jgi:hypothetical protein
MPLSDDEVQAMFKQGASPQEVAAFEAHLDSQSQPAQTKSPLDSPQAPSMASGTAQGAKETQTAQAQPAAPSQDNFFNPKEMLNRAVGSLPDMIPFAQAGKNLIAGKPAYDSGAEGASRMAGDIGGTAAIGAGIASEGAVPAIQGLAKISGLNAALNALGIPQGAAKIGESMQKATDSVQIPSKVMGINGLGDALNVIARVPGALADTATNLAPYLLAGKATGAAEPVVKGAGEAPAPAEAASAQSPTPESLLLQHGGELSPAMKAKNPLVKGVATGIEKLAAVNPVTSSLPEGIQAKNVAAVQKYLEGSLGPDVAGLSMTDYAPKLAQSIAEYKGDRSGRFAQAENSLSGIESKLPKPIGQMASDSIIKMLQDKGVPSDESGFNPALMTGNEKMDPTTAKGLIAMERQVRNAKTIPDLLAQRQNIDRSGIMNFDAPPDAMGNLKKMARGIVNNTLTDAVASSGDQNAISAWKNANQEYSQTAPIMKKLGKAGSNALLGPEALTKIITDKAQGGQSLDRLKANLSPDQWGSVQDAGINAILDKSKTNGVLSAEKLKTNMGQNMAHVFDRLDPDKQNVLKNAQQMMQKAGIADLSKDNPPGSGTAAIRNAHFLGALAAPHVMIPETLGLGGYYGAAKALPFISEKIGNMKTAAGNAMRAPLPGTGSIPPYILDMVKRAAARPGALASGQ